MERILDDPPPPPPAMVPDLDPETPGIAEMPLKEQLAIHRQQESCNNCHKKIDPWGIPLEEFDAIGLYRAKSLRLTSKEKGGARTEEFHASVEVSDVMPDGSEINGAQLKDYLLETRRSDFARAIVVKLASYGLGQNA